MTKGYFIWDDIGIIFKYSLLTTSKSNVSSVVVFGLGRALRRKKGPSTLASVLFQVAQRKTCVLSAQAQISFDIGCLGSPFSCSSIQGSPKFLSCAK